MVQSTSLRSSRRRRRVPIAIVLILVAALFALPGAGLSTDEQTPVKAWVTAAQVAPPPQTPQENPIILRNSLIASPLVPPQDSPDVAVTTLSNTTQSENSVFVDPNNPDFILNSNNSSDWPVTQIYGADAWVSTNGGQTWTGSVLGAGGVNRGDPATAINLSGRLFVGFIAQDYGQGIAYSDNAGASWTQVQVAPGGFILDKNHLWVDNSPGSAFAGNLYAAWTNLQTGALNENEIEFRRSTNNGASWSSSLNLSSAVAAGSHNQGVNIQAGPNGDVYVVWTIYDSWPSDETALGLAKSTNGGSSFAPATRIITGIRGHRNTPLGGGKTMRHNSFPSMTVNQQTGQVFVVWTNIGVPGVNTGDADIYMISSSNGGASWSTPVRVNQDTPANGKDQWFPWIACDAVTGELACIFYDSRNFAANDMAETFVALSGDNGATWEDFRVSDVAWSGDGIPGFSGNYAGDYLGIAARGNKVYPMWSDTRTGNALVYVSPFTLGPPPPPRALAQADVPVSGTVSGSFTDTHTSNNVYESITEVVQGGKPANRFSMLEHRWNFNVAAGGTLTFSLEAFRPNSADGDNFSFEYSLDNTNFIPLAAVNSPTEQVYTASLPNTIVGAVQVRVVDTNHTAGTTALSSVSVDQMYIESAGTPPPPDTMFVNSIAVVRVSAGSNRFQGQATVNVRNQSNLPVFGATVAGHFSGPTAEVVSGKTAPNGNVVFTSARVRSPVGVWCFTVDNVSYGFNVYDASRNVETSDCEGGAAAAAVAKDDTPALESPARVGGGFEFLQTPNPFNPTTSFIYSLPAAGHVSLVVYDVAGRKVETLVDGAMPAGRHTYTWDARGMASGVYFVRFRAGAFEQVRRAVLLK